MNAAARRATYQDVLDAPPNMVAQVVAGVLYTHPRPASPHANTCISLAGHLSERFRHGRGGPGGWIILFEPELHLGADPDILVPDIAGWRRERMPRMPSVANFTLAPDWLCEIVSPSTERLDREVKLPIYLREQVRHVWLVDPLKETLEAYVHGGRQWDTLAVHRGAGLVRVPPFDAIELDLAELFSD
jgi:Uma2 family endonuclease